MGKIGPVSEKFCSDGKVKEANEQMTDNAELVYFTHFGLHFSALVDLMPDDQEIALFYEDGDVTDLMKLFSPEHRATIERLAVTAAMKKRAEQAEEDKWSDASE